MARKPRKTSSVNQETSLPIPELPLTYTEEFLKNFDPRMIPVCESVVKFVREFSDENVKQEIGKLSQEKQQLQKYYETACKDRDRYSNRECEAIREKHRLQERFDKLDRVSVKLVITTGLSAAWAIIATILLCI